MRLNVGCGPDYRDGYVNVDACRLFRADEYMTLPKEQLAAKFGAGSADELITNDFIEHLFWSEAAVVLMDFFGVLVPGGKLEIGTIDLERLFNSSVSVSRKMELIRGAQGQPYRAGTKPTGTLGLAWDQRPDLFAHKYVWTASELHESLSAIGFKVMGINWLNEFSFVMSARKPA